MVLSEKYKIVFSQSFKKKYNIILYYLTDNYSLEYAQRFNSILKDKLNFIKENPYMYAVKYEYMSSRNIYYSVRVLKVESYLVLYRIDNGYIKVMNIVSHMENYKKKYMN